MSFTFVIAITLVITGCHKVEDLPYYDNGNAVTLTASTTSIVPTAADSVIMWLLFSWTNPEYSTDSSTYKFVLEIDSTGRNFSKKVTKVVNGARDISFTGQELNNILAEFGFAPGQTFGFDVRVMSSYANNNEQLKSNVIKFDISFLSCSNYACTFFYQPGSVAS